MNKSWKDPKTIVGNAARGEYYFHRANIVNTIWNELEKGNSILIAAPRRVGKTSIMRYIEENPKKNYRMVFSNIEGILSEKELYKRIFDLILSCLNKNKNIFNRFKNYLKSKNITEVDIKGKIKIEKNEIDHEKELDALLDELDSQNDTKIILLLDELPEVLFNLHKIGKTDEAVSILKNMRRWRQNLNNKNILFVLAGSVGIHYVVNAIENRSSDLNDLAEVNCFPLERSEFYEYIKWATNGASVQYEEALTDYFADKVQYFVPYFLNLMLNEINLIAKKNDNPVVNEEIIDAAFYRISVNNDYFSDWKARLKDYMQNSDYNFVNELLTHLAHKDELTIEMIYEKSVKHEKTDNFMDYIDNLKKDGYIMEKDGRFLFISPFLKAFWKHVNPVYHG